MMKKVNKLIAPEIYANISLNTRIFSIISECLPDELATHIECIGSDDKALRLAANSAAVASQLRFYVDAMLTSLHNAKFAEFKRIKIVNQFTNTTKPPQSRPAGRYSPHLSEQTAQLIRSTASTIDDERLRQAMGKLAEIGEKNRKD